MQMLGENFTAPLLDAPSPVPLPDTKNRCIFSLPLKDDGTCYLDDASAVTFVTLIITGMAACLGWLIFKRRIRALEHLRKVTHFLTEEEIIELQVHAPAFSESLLRQLFIRFMNLDSDRSGTLTCQEFCAMRELRCNPLAYRLFDAFDSTSVTTVVCGFFW